MAFLKIHTTSTHYMDCFLHVVCDRVVVFARQDGQDLGNTLVHNGASQWCFVAANPSVIALAWVERELWCDVFYSVCCMLAIPPPRALSSCRASSSVSHGYLGFEHPVVHLQLYWIVFRD